MISLDEIARDPKRAEQTETAEAKTLLASGAGVVAVLSARLMRDAESSGAEPTDRLLDVNEASAVLGVSVDSVYRGQWPFVVMVGSNKRYSANGIQRWIRGRQRG